VPSDDTPRPHLTNDGGETVSTARREHLRPQEHLVRMMRDRSKQRFAYKALKLLGVDIPWTVEIGDGFQLPHGGVGAVIHAATKIGNNVKVCQGVTLGFADPTEDEAPHPLGALGRIVIEDDVVVGAGAKVLFGPGETLTVGKGAVICPNAVVLESVPSGEVWMGIPARSIGDQSFTEGTARAIAS
jgi:serine O-acetyltransferase